MLYPDEIPPSPQCHLQNEEPYTHYIGLHSAGTFLQHYGQGYPGQLLFGKGTSNHLDCQRQEKNQPFGNVLEHFPIDLDTPSVSLPVFLREKFRRAKNIIP